MRALDMPDVAQASAAELEVLDGARVGVRYACQVVAADDVTVVVTAPRDKGFLAPVPDGSKVRLRLKMKKYEFRFDTVVIGRDADHAAALCVKAPQWMDRSERVPLRRHTFQATAECALIRAASKSVARTFSGVVRDVSLGGLRMICDQPLAEGDSLVVTIPLGTQTARFESVVRHTQMPDGVLAKQLVGIEFVRRDAADLRRLETFLNDRDQSSRLSIDRR